MSGYDIVRTIALFFLIAPISALCVTATICMWKDFFGR